MCLLYVPLGRFRVKFLALANQRLSTIRYAFDNKWLNSYTSLFFGCASPTENPTETLVKAPAICAQCRASIWFRHIFHVFELIQQTTTQSPR
jgi:hypothetical protein